MSTPRALICLFLLALCPLVQAQTAPTTYTITEGLMGDPGTLTIYRSGDKILMETVRADQTATSLYDLKTGVSLTWDPKASPIQCSAGRFSGDWGDPFAMTAEITADIAKGDMKPIGTATIGGILTQVYGEALPQGNVKVWLDKKDNLVMRATTAGPGVDTAPTALVDIQKVSFTAPDARLFTLPAACAGVHPAPTAAEVIADETGDSADNYVNANLGPGSANSCSILVRVVTAKTMAPIVQPVAIRH